MTSKSQQYGLDGMAKSAQRLLKLMEMKAPENILGSEIVILFGYAVLACGQDLFTELGKKAIAHQRDVAGFCQSCDAEIRGDLTFPPICEHCDAVDYAEYEKYKKYLEKEGNYEQT